MSCAPLGWSQLLFSRRSYRAGGHKVLSSLKTGSVTFSMMATDSPPRRRSYANFTITPQPSCCAPGVSTRVRYCRTPTNFILSPWRTLSIIVSIEQWHYVYRAPISLDAAFVLLLRLSAHP